VNLTLWGAYHRLVRPLEQRSLAVHLSFDPPATLRAVIDAEELAAHASAHVETRRSGFVLRHRVTFADDTGDRHVLELVQRLGDWTLRGWTELTGTIARDGDAAWGRACLRLDYRGTFG
jgi:hypothetical protein